MPYRITVQDVKLFPQGYSALAVHPELLRDEPSVLLMDIGGWTVDLMRLDKGIPDASTCRSLELGMIRCVDEIREQVRRDTGLSLTDAQTERILSGKPCSLPEETRLSSGGRDGCTRSACFPRLRKPGLIAEHFCSSAANGPCWMRNMIFSVTRISG